jgi:hypothetical protein
MMRLLGWGALLMLGCEASNAMRDAAVMSLNRDSGSISDGSALADGGSDALLGPLVRFDGGGDASVSPLPYPTRSPYRIKGLQPDFWPNLDEIAGNNVGGVALNLVWAHWEPKVKAPPCGGNEEEYDGRCFVIENAVDQAIEAWTARNVTVTAVVYGVPAWARIGTCTPSGPGMELFCAPTDATPYGRFAGMLARRYNGLRQHGRIADFVIHNEVNANDWFDVGCGQGTPCPEQGWVSTYASNYVAAYDAVLREQPFAKVLVSLEHHFGRELDALSSSNPVMSGERFLTLFAPLVGSRAWRVAFHPYPPDLRAPTFSADDWPKITYGNIGTLVGWLRRSFPTTPSTWEVQLTESGVNSLSPRSNETAQAQGLCASFQNVLGTPGIESYIYHRMKDHPTEVAQGLAVGLRNADGSPKQAWATFALANRNDVSPPQLSCGFEHLPYVRLTRSYHPIRGHWASTRIAPAGFQGEASYRLLRNQQPETRLLFECRERGHNLLSPSVDCEGLLPLGPVGYAYTVAQPGTVELFRCRVGTVDHFVSTSPTCEGQMVESSLGWVLP